MGGILNVNYPWAFDGSGRTARVSYDQHVRQLVEQCLFTAPGERVNRPDFGCGLQQLVFAPNSPELAAAVQYGVQANLARWLGDVIGIAAVEVSADDATLSVLVRYRVLATGTEDDRPFTRSVG